LKIKLNDAKVSIGIASINENFNDVLKFNPTNNPITIVKPDLDKPGIIANA
tara:strand:+ start:457 stop:609 length:153 start_codon:yes stop_codon:yes gene_type:complete